MAEANALCLAVARGDEENTRLLIKEGADVNVEGTGGVSVIGALLLGALSLEDIDASQSRATARARLSIAHFLLHRRAFTLRSLNAPKKSLNGLTPLCIAAYLGRVDFVSALLEKGDGLMLVDGTDFQRATPAMYAARDGHKDVLQYLIQQGARVDSVDCHHRSVIFYAIEYPQCLWSCEISLRLRRAESLLSHKKKRKLKLALQQSARTYVSHAAALQQHPLSSLSQSEWTTSSKLLTDAISSSNHLTVHSLLFPSSDPDTYVPILVNFRDRTGWSPIHYCVAAQQPNARVLDALFLAGADLTMYTGDTENACTALHVLAREGGSGDCTSFRLYAFVVHLVRDLGAPLDAVDERGNTCLHVAAQYGSCLDILMALLECDEDGTVRKIRNADGYTAEEVAKPEFLSAFEPDDGTRRPDSAASMRTIKATFSNSSLASSYTSASSDSSDSDDDDCPSDQYPPPISADKESLRNALAQSREVEEFMGILEVFAQETAELNAMARYQSEADASSLSADDVEDRLQHCRQDAAILLENLRLLVDKEFADLESMKGVHGSLQDLICRLENEVQRDKFATNARSRPLYALHQRQPTLSLRTSYSTLRSGATTPSLIASGSASSQSSFSSFSELATPADSPRFERRHSPLGLGAKQKDAAAEFFKDSENELDFACAIAAGSMTRSRRASSALYLGTADFSTTAPASPLELGTDLVSVPPEFTSSSPLAGISENYGLNFGLGSTSTRSTRRESWLGPIVRQTNARTFQTHLENLLEIERVLFGAEEDAEREYGPCPKLSADEDIQQSSWRECVEVLHEVANEEEDGEDSNFLEMAETETLQPEADDIDEAASMVTTTQRDETPEPDVPDVPTSTASSILFLAHKEVLAIAEAIRTAEHSLQSAEQYLSRAERVMNRVLEDKEHAVQAARLSLALSDLCHVEEDFNDKRFSVRNSPEYRSLAPASSPVAKLRIPKATMGGHPPLPVITEQPQNAYEYDNKKLMSPLSPTFPLSRTSSPGAMNASDDMRSLRRLLVRKIPAGLTRAAEEIDSTAVWLGVVQGVVRNVKRSRI